MMEHTIKLGNQWLERIIEIDTQGTLRTASIRNIENDQELLQSGGDEFAFAGYSGKHFRIFKCQHFCYIDHSFEEKGVDLYLTIQLEMKLADGQGLSPFAVGQWDGKDQKLSIELEYQIYGHYPVIRKRIKIKNEGSVPLRIQHLTWEDLLLVGGKERRVDHAFFTKTSPSIVDNMDDCVMAVLWPEQGSGVLIATEAPGSMKRLEVFKDPDRLRVMYNNTEETIFEWIIEANETFESDYCFLLPFAEKGLQNTLDGPYARFVREKLAICDVKRIPDFTINTWETYNEIGGINEEIVLGNIKVAAELGIDSYQLDCGWYVHQGDYRPHPVQFPNGIEPIVEACRKHNIRLGLWMSVPNVWVNSLVALEHPEWFLLDENEQHGHMIGWSDTEIMCLDSDYKFWILDQLDTVVKRYGVELLKLDLAAVRDPYNPGKSIGCHAKNHYHRSPKSSHLGIYRNMFWIMDELRVRNPDCIIDLTFELYGVMHGTDLAHVQHAHQNWIMNQNTQWLDVFRRMIHTRSRVVPSYTLNYGSCHLTDPLSRTYGFWSAMTSHGLYYCDLRELSVEQRDYYRYWISWIKAYRQENDFYAFHKVSDVFHLPDTPDHVDRRYYPYSFYDAARIDSHAQSWDGVAKLSDQGEGLVLIFRPGECNTVSDIIRFPWMKENSRYEIIDVLLNQSWGLYETEKLYKGLEVQIPDQHGVKVLQFILK